MSLAPRSVSQTVTLSRVHKLIERVRASIADHHSAVASSLHSATLKSPMKVELDACAQRAIAGLASREKAEALSRELASLRGIVAAENARLGIHELLAKQEALGKHMTVLKAAIDDGETTHLAVSDLTPGQNLGDYGRSVSPLDREQLAQLKVQAADLQTELYMLSDLVADKNASKVTISVSADVAKFLAA